MPQAVVEYLESNNLSSVDLVKREIINLYEDDFTKIDASGLAGDIYDQIPSQLSNNASRYSVSKVKDTARTSRSGKLLADMLSSYTVNIAYHANDPNVGMSLAKDSGKFKLFASDTGLTENVIYNKLLSDKFEANLGYVYENDYT